MSSLTSATTSLPTLTQSGARVALQAAEQHALELGVPMSIAVVDAHAHLLTSTRMDGAKITSINTAVVMAFTAAGNRIGNTDSGRFTTLGGGVPIFSAAGDILGAIGCSTGTSMQDEAVANAGRDAVVVLIRRERESEERRLSEERQRLLTLEDLEGMERWCKRMRFDGEDSGSVSISGSALGKTESTVGGLAPDTPPGEGEIYTSFVGEVAVGRY
ncbi:DUF336-domain-containing protein [Clathrospora elynae]|uniref:DUF336-domain-containing protein n=1 Tax=Clathrospora elynae TaxID=706981 RepID=A0A6A5S4A5_9PLEO|nr:DUF336-domain-containing protein [Clathrospora elynae]